MTKPNYKRLTMQVSGLTPEQYDKQYKAFSKRVANYNRVTGSQYSATKEFYYSFKYAGQESIALQNIKKFSATQSHKKGGEAPTKSQMEAGRKAVIEAWLPNPEQRKKKDKYYKPEEHVDKWKGSYFEKILNQIYEKDADGNYLYTPEQINQQMKEWAEKVKQHRSGETDEDAPIYGS